MVHQWCKAAQNYELLVQNTNTTDGEGCSTTRAQIFTPICLGLQPIYLIMNELHHVIWSFSWVIPIKADISLIFYVGSYTESTDQFQKPQTLDTPTAFYS